MVNIAFQYVLRRFALYSCYGLQHIYCEKFCLLKHWILKLGTFDMFLSQKQIIAFSSRILCSIKARAVCYILAGTEVTLLRGSLLSFYWLYLPFKIRRSWYILHRFKVDDMLMMWWYPFII